MGEAGILGEDDRVELIDGEILEMTPIGWRHMWCVRQLIRLFAGFAETSSGVRYEVDAQNPITLGEHGEPQPDLVLLRDPPVGRLPGPGEVVLVVEVADTSLGFDRAIKLPRYAGAGIAEAWLVDLSSETIEVHSGPGPGGYRRTTRYTRGDRVEAATVPDLAFDTSEAMPPKEPDGKG